mmetsp:Transcript_6063/g.19761  ORF Transcript_6063/g.19761 Transcript_6063/m.19761 type:complete len:301 (-) Transcript_6063:143-1045(-)
MGAARGNGGGGEADAGLRCDRPRGRAGGVEGQGVRAGGADLRGDDLFEHEVAGVRQRRDLYDLPLQHARRDLLRRLLVPRATAPEAAKLAVSPHSAPRRRRLRFNGLALSRRGLRLLRGVVLDILPRPDLPQARHQYGQNGIQLGPRLLLQSSGGHPPRLYVPQRNRRPTSRRLHRRPRRLCHRRPRRCHVLLRLARALPRLRHLLHHPRQRLQSHLHRPQRRPMGQARHPLRHRLPHALPRRRLLLQASPHAGKPQAAGRGNPDRQRRNSPETNRDSPSKVAASTFFLVSLFHYSLFIT